MKLFHKLPLIFILNFLFPFDGDTHDFFLPNGMKVIFMEKDMKPEVSLGIYYNVGSKYEEVGQKGLNRILGNVYQNIRKENYEKKASNRKNEHRNGGVCELQRAFAEGGHKFSQSSCRFE